MTTLRSALSLSCILLPVSAISAAEPPRVLADKEFYTKGSFIAYAAPWSTYDGPNAGLKHGVDYQDEITVEPKAFPSNTGFNWHWPLTPPKESGVYGYNAVSYGSYDGGVPETAIEPKQVKAIRTLSESFTFTMARPTGDFNVLTEFFLTGEKGGVEKLAEIGFFLHASKSAITFATDGEQLGTFRDAARREWKVSVQPAPAGPYYMFLPEGDVLTGTVDFKAALDFLKAKGKLAGTEWFNGLAFGIEPVTGSGSLKLESLKIDYK